jgi:hypothetical protein
MATQRYRVLVPCRSDERGQQYRPGDTVADGDFPPEVIANWLAIGVLAPDADGLALSPKRGRRSAGKGSKA